MTPSAASPVSTMPSVDFSVPRIIGAPSPAWPTTTAHSHRHVIRVSRLHIATFERNDRLFKHGHAPDRDRAPRARGHALSDLRPVSPRCDRRHPPPRSMSPCRDHGARRRSAPRCAGTASTRTRSSLAARRSLGVYSAERSVIDAFRLRHREGEELADLLAIARRFSQGRALTPASPQDPLVKPKPSRPRGLPRFSFGLLRSGYLVAHVAQR